MQAVLGKSYGAILRKTLKTVAIDLTPVLPGGENGGAKIFTIELIGRLANTHPGTQFVLLTRASSHEELAVLDRKNIRRLMVLPDIAHSESPTPSRVRLLDFFLRLFTHLPGRVKRALGKILRYIKKRSLLHTSRSLLRDMQADLLFCPFTAPTYAEQGIPTVCTIYDLQYKTYPEFFSEEEVIHRDATFIEACRRATALSAISDYSRNSAISSGNLDPEKIRTIHIHLALRISQEKGASSNILEKLGLAPQRYLIYPANFWKHKNHEMLFTAFGLACKEGLDPDIKLVCTGAPGERQAWLGEAARAMNLENRILFPGYLSNTTLSELMSNSKGLVFPSLYEGFGIPVVEAMAAGIPVACSNTTSLPEVAGDAALLFDPRYPDQISRAIKSLFDDIELRDRLIRKGYLRSEKFSDLDRMAREYWELFEYASTSELHGKH